MSKLFDKWDLDEVKVEDLGLIKYICLDETLVPLLRQGPIYQII